MNSSWVIHDFSMALLWLRYKAIYYKVVEWVWEIIIPRDNSCNGKRANGQGRKIKSLNPCCNGSFM